MSLQDKITDDMKAALRAGEKERLTLLRMLLADLNRFREDGGHDALSEEQEITVLRKSYKMRLDSVAAAEEAGRAEMAAHETREAAWIEQYLPKLMDEATTYERAKALLAELAITERKDMGRFMKAWMSQYKATSDGRIVQKVLGELLQG